jgi:hypothetical protein
MNAILLTEKNDGGKPVTPHTKPLLIMAQL